MSALGSHAAMQMQASQAPADWEEGTAVVGYAGTLITVYYSACELGIEVDGVEHAGLTLEADDLSETMRDSLVRSLRAQFDREADHAPV